MAGLEACHEGVMEARSVLGNVIEMTDELIHQCIGLGLPGTAAQASLLRQQLEEFGPEVDDVCAAMEGAIARAEKIMGRAEASRARPAPRFPSSGVTPSPESAIRQVPERPRDLGDFEQQQRWAEKAYRAIRADASDISRMSTLLAERPRPSGAVGFSRAEIQEIKEHLFVREQLIEDYETGEPVSRRFDPDEEIAAAWVRLQVGNEIYSDLVLLEHELAEIDYLRVSPDATYQEAHREANKRYNWQSLIENG